MTPFLTYRLTCDDLSVHPSLLDTGIELAREGRLSESREIFENAFELDGQLANKLGSNPDRSPRHIAGVILADRSREAKERGDWNNATSFLKEAVVFLPDLEDELDEVMQRMKAAEELNRKSQKLRMEKSLRDFNASANQD